MSRLALVTGQSCTYIQDIDSAPRRFDRRTEACMNVRLNYGKVAPGVYDAMDALDRYLAHCDVEKALIMLVQLRASQINGCAYCLDMHWKDLCAIGERAQRLYSLNAWRECPYYTE